MEHLFETMLNDQCSMMMSNMLAYTNSKMKIKKKENKKNYENVLLDQPIP